MSSINFKFFKSIKFKLAIIFTSILFVLVGVIILLFNLAIDNYLSTRMPDSNQPNIIIQPAELTASGEAKPVRDLRAIYSDNLESIQRKSVTSLFPLVVLCFALGYFLAGRFLKPLEYLNSQIDKIKTDTLGAQISNFTEDEVGKTISSFNEMSIRLKSSFEKQSQFVQDASHELRTPLTIMKTNLETVLDDGSANISDLRKSMKESLLEIDSVTDLANDLLTLSRPQSRQRKSENISDILADCIGKMSDLAIRNNVILKSEINTSDLLVSINKSEICRAIKNIIDNAIKYSRGVESPMVTVRAIDDGDRVLIEIIDNGRGIPATDIDKIFDRFYRVDKSRDRETGGFGLGLAITKKIIIEHNGSVSVVSRPALTIFTLSLPKVCVI